MRDVSHDIACLVCAANAGEREVPGGVVFQNDLWVVVPAAPPYGVPGWMTLQTRRHVGGPAHFNDAEAASFGPTLRHLELVLEQVTGALRIYTAALGESFPHFHGHMVPRFREMPNDAKAWEVFDLPRLASLGAISVDATEAERIIEAYRIRLGSYGPPG